MKHYIRNTHFFMKEVLGILLLSLLTLSSCVEGGHNHTYIISEHSKDEVTPDDAAPSFKEEEAR